MIDVPSPEKVFPRGPVTPARFPRKIDQLHHDYPRNENYLSVILLACTGENTRENSLVSRKSILSVNLKFRTNQSMCIRYRIVELKIVEVMPCVFTLFDRKKRKLGSFDFQYFSCFYLYNLIYWFIIIFMFV